MKISRVNNTLLNSLYKNAGSTFSIKVQIQGLII